MRCARIILLLAVLSAHSSEGYRILCIFPFAGPSHFRMFEALCKGLARKGHRVDMISHFPSKLPIANYVDIVDLSGARQNIADSFSVEYGKSLQRSMTYYIATKFGGDLCDLMGQENMRDFIDNPPKDPPYHLVITEYLGASCYLGFGHLLKAPVAVVTSFLQAQPINDFTGNPHSHAFFSGAYNEDPTVVSFIDRIRNLLSNFWGTQMFYHYTSDQTAVMRKYLGRDTPDIRELERAVALVLTNDHYTITGARPITPVIVNVGGLHVEFDDSKLTTELEAWMDSADHGVIYFTFGSLTRIETLPESTLQELYATFEKISPVKVLMKCVNITKLPDGLPGNVFTKPWMPQIPVLKHKNTRAFITHGGLMGVQEAVYYGVPMIGIPIFADQMKNINIFVQKNMAIRINLDDLTEQSMDSALNAILHDSKYKESARRQSELFRDRPMSAMDTATYWIEYVIRNGPDSLRSSAVDMVWWKRNLLDVFSFLTISLVLVTFVLIKVFIVFVTKICESSIRIEKKIN
nr:UDP-glucuronosyltransferase 1-6-like isoform X1 [Nomia melanderi]XP_031829091.1 UDP-glucuronosyltransferase 1-6-like isoform X1 [Nomia melanderi]XP_031829092.1 UDP-glucuronosyltransferase 1-6-like isoform X1 [Nomia melanderi]